VDTTAVTHQIALLLRAMLIEPAIQVATSLKLKDCIGESKQLLGTQAANAHLRYFV